MSDDVYWQEMLARCDTKSWVLEVRGCAWAELRVTGESLVIVHGLQAITALTLAHEAATSLPALIAELRAAREFIRVSLADTYDSTDYRLALEAYKRATKGDG